MRRSTAAPTNPFLVYRESRLSLQLSVYAIGKVDLISIVATFRVMCGRDDCPGAYSGQREEGLGLVGCAQGLWTIDSHLTECGGDALDPAGTENLRTISSYLQSQ
jgi:hypothetical protein